MSQSSLGKMHFTRMDQGTDEDFQVLKRVHERTVQQLPAQLMGLLDGLGADTAYNITRRDHCLQAATRALRDGKDEETSSWPCCTTSARRSVRSTMVK